LLDPDALERAAAIIGQGLQNVQVFFRISLLCQTMNGQHAGGFGLNARADAHDGGGGAAGCRGGGGHGFQAFVQHQFRAAFQHASEAGAGFLARAGRHHFPPAFDRIAFENGNNLVRVRVVKENGTGVPAEEFVRDAGDDRAGRFQRGSGNQFLAEAREGHCENFRLLALGDVLQDADGADGLAVLIDVLDGGVGNPARFSGAGDDAHVAAPLFEFPGLDAAFGFLASQAGGFAQHDRFLDDARPKFGSDFLWPVADELFDARADEGVGFGDEIVGVGDGARAANGVLVKPLRAAWGGLDPQAADRVARVVAGGRPILNGPWRFRFPAKVAHSHEYRQKTGEGLPFKRPWNLCRRGGVVYC